MKRLPRGFTLIELMVALVVSSLLVGMILAIFSRMSISYRGQQQIAGLQQVLAAARASIELDAKQAGLGMSQGFIYAGDGRLHPAVSVANNKSGTGPDEIAFFYADPSVQAVVTSTAWGSTMTVDNSTPFQNDDLVVVTSVDTTQSGLGSADGNIAKYSACMLRVQSKAANTLTFYNVGPFGSNNEGHCTVLPVPSAGTMIYKMVAHGYRIDSTRLAIGALQQSPTGGLVSTDWGDLAYGFTDIQTSLQIYHTAFLPGDTPDPDTDPLRDWYSDNMQSSLTQTTPPGSPTLVPPEGLLQMSISLVARTDREVEGIASLTTPRLVDPLNVTNNTLGDRPEIALPSVDPALTGSRIFRYTTFQVDFRNLGVGR